VSMPVTVMQIRIVRMAVPQAGVAMSVRMWLAGRIVWPMHVLMVLIVHVPMFVLNLLVQMIVFVPFHQVEIEADPHQHRGKHKLYAHRVIEQRDRQDSADERCR
jgi:hypothetical protein